jgi:hypothetical protein
MKKVAISAVTNFRSLSRLQRIAVILLSITISVSFLLSNSKFLSFAQAESVVTPPTPPTPPSTPPATITPTPITPPSPTITVSPTPAPIFNRAPVIVTNSLATGFVWKKYTSKVTARDYDKDKISLNAKYLPSGLSLSQCSYTQPFWRLFGYTELTCYINGIPTIAGKYTVIITATDEHQLNTIKSLPLLIKPTRN